MLAACQRISERNCTAAKCRTKTNEETTRTIENLGRRLAPRSNMLSRSRY